MNKEELVQQVQTGTGLDREKAEQVSKTLVGSLCGRISQGEVEHLNSEAHEIIQSMCTFQRHERPEGRYDLEQVLTEVREQVHLDDRTILMAALAAFHALKEAIPAEEARNVADQLPPSLKIVWLEA